jgi:lipopolysaccharide transport system permease protein
MTTQEWTNTIEPRRSLVDFRLFELWRCRHLVGIFVRRDFVASYKQTILGPVWLIFPPLISTVVFTIIFGNVAQISTDGSPQLLFYMVGIMTWGFFNACIVASASVFTSQAGLFSKIYFPRLTVPISNVISTLISSSIQFIIFLSFLIYFWAKGKTPGPNAVALLLPVLFLMMSGLALGVGTVISAMTAKYRDLNFLLGFGIQLWMYATTMIYPLSSVPEKYRTLALLNPMTSIMETMRYGWIGNGTFPVGALIYSFCVASVCFIVGVAAFNLAERTAMDLV